MSIIAEVNGTANADPVSSNQTIVTPHTDLAAQQAQPTEGASIPGPDFSHLPASLSTATTEVNLSIPAHVPDTSILLDTAEAAIESAIEDVAGTSTVLPAVEALESDLRATVSPLPSVPSLQSGSGEHSPNLYLDLNNESAGIFTPPQTDDPSAVLNPTSEAAPSPIPRNPSGDLLLEQSAAELDLDAPSQATFDPSSVEGEMHLTDTQMADVPQSPPPAKVARGREDDNDENQPAAKRTRTEEEDTVMTQAPAPTQNGEASGDKPKASSISPYQGDSKDSEKRSEDTEWQKLPGTCYNTMAKLCPDLWRKDIQSNGSLDNRDEAQG